jgi:hypothetical protein
MASLSVDDYDSDGGQKCNRRGQCHQSNHASKVAALRRSKISFVIHAGSHSYVRLFAARDHHVISGTYTDARPWPPVPCQLRDEYIVSYPEQIDKSIKAQVLWRYQIGYS